MSWRHPDPGIFLILAYLILVTAVVASFYIAEIWNPS